eukprot:403366550
MSEVDNWLHEYRKLSRDDPLKFSHLSHNFTDSRLKFRRNFLYVLKKMYLADKNEELLKIIQHILKTNTNRNWDVLQNPAFLDQMICTLQILEITNIQQSKKFFLLNNPRTFAVLTYFTQLHSIQTGQQELYKNELFNLAKKCQDSNKERNVQYTELVIAQMIDNPSIKFDEIIKYLNQQKLQISDLTYTSENLIVKVQLDKTFYQSKSSYLKKRHLKKLFDKNPWCVNTMKTLCIEYRRKIKDKPENLLNMLDTLVTYLEYAEKGGETEQWEFLVSLLNKAQSLISPKTYKEYFEEKNNLDTWDKIILGTNFLIQIQLLATYKLQQNQFEQQKQLTMQSNNFESVDISNNYEIQLKRVQVMLKALDILGINSDRVEKVQQFLQQF